MIVTRGVGTKRLAFTLVELLVVIAIIGVLVALLLPAIQAARESARRSDCVNRIRQIALALHHYHDTQGHFPTGAISRRDTKPAEGDGKLDDYEGMWGWQTLVLPFMEEETLYNRLEVSKPDGDDRFPNYDVDDNSADPIAARPLPAFVCPSCPGGDINPFFKFNAKANYVCSDNLMGTNTAVAMRQVTDGTSKTFLLSERQLLDGPADQLSIGALWITGELCLSGAVRRFQPNVPINSPFSGSLDRTSNCQIGDTNESRFVASSAHPGGAVFAMVDASVHFVSEGIASRPAGNQDPGPGFVYQNLFVKDDSEPTGAF